MPRVSLGRRTADFVQKKRGREALRFHFELLPICASDLPEGLRHVSLVLERSSKAQHTKPSSVNHTTFRAYWEEVLHQRATLYRDGQHFLPKEYTIKLQSCSENSPGGEGKLISKGKLDLAKFCLLDEQGSPKPSIPIHDVVYLKPVGRIKLRVLAKFSGSGELPDIDTAASRASTTMLDEQDLSGFGSRSRPGSRSSTPGFKLGANIDEELVAEEMERTIRSAPPSPRKFRIGGPFGQRTHSRDDECEAIRELLKNEQRVKVIRNKALDLLEQWKEKKDNLFNSTRIQHQLENEVHSLGLQKKRLLDRLRILEDAMVQNTYDHLIQTLVDTKVWLAESDLCIQQLRGMLFRESNRCQQLEDMLTNLGVDYEAVLKGEISLGECRVSGHSTWWWWLWRGWW
ncbi:hypothetical protein BSKO_01490 [Bryopsis sp. KO-2023]|nr:hypothetical protein BSKO_01490 [Bryopsis sp. KO-2023]